MALQPGDIVFFHGLESGPGGHKATWLRKHHQAVTPAFDNRAAIDFFRQEPSRLQDFLRLHGHQLEKSERDVLALRGVAGGTKLPIPEVAQELGMSRHRVRDTEQRALAMLRALAGPAADQPTGSVEEVLAGPLATARAAVAHKPALLIGSSFGGLLATRLLLEGMWRGPTLLLAPASRKILGDRPLPDDTVGVVIHGRHDRVVPVEDGRWLASTGGPDTMFWEVDDDHRLGSILHNGVLDAAIRWATRG